MPVLARDRWRVRALVALGALYSLVAAATTPFTVASDVVTAIPIVAFAVALVIRWPARPQRVPLTGVRRYAPWILLAVGVGLWELVDYAARGSRAAHPTLSSMADALDRHYVGKSVVFFGWLCLCAYVVHVGAERSDT